jgi:predicted dithiol-disulfide oxidoreductase (DUF899 family)
LPELLVRFGSHRRRLRAPGRARRTLALVSRAPSVKIEAFKQRWLALPMGVVGRQRFQPRLSRIVRPGRAGSPVDYNYTQQAFPSEEAPGISVFSKDARGRLPAY